MISGKVNGAVGGDSCTAKDGGPYDVKVDLLSSSGDLVSSVLTSETGNYVFTNILPGLRWLLSIVNLSSFDIFP